ncbi:Fur family transcriptional regulator [Natranaerobius thermophilus]|uniref:Ferric uptake regulator, Fur family n=2 Tax=Natranaerobius TaxID=375928 RepID=B2A6C8_NATTJ|nr:transcriptional repressor [Natranaerobius thermophilus]ACB84139.1 ferric uptake regulator, Fur family [Natranaerobius thermophilus JW/NM-WN-LF]
MSDVKKGKKKRMTKQRKIILNVLKNTKSHPTADWVYDQVREVLPNISLGTVYRNLKVLKEMGEIMELDFGSTYSRFDGNPHNHYHFVCNDCERVYDIDMPTDESLLAKADEVSEHQVQEHRLEFYGTCQECYQQSTAQG